MSDYFIGAYLEIDCNKMTVENNYLICGNGHQKGGVVYPWSGNACDNEGFCTECGSPISLVAKQEREYPTHIVDDILPINYEDVLSVITPYEYFGKGKIFAMSNGWDGVEDYWYADDIGRAIMPMPTPNDIKRIMQEFLSVYDKILVELTNSPLVKSLEVKFGIVRMEDY